MVISTDLELGGTPERLLRIGIGKGVAKVSLQMPANVGEAAEQCQAKFANAMTTVGVELEKCGQLEILLLLAQFCHRRLEEKDQGDRSGLFGLLHATFTAINRHCADKTIFASVGGKANSDSQLQYLKRSDAVCIYYAAKYLLVGHGILDESPADSALLREARHGHASLLGIFGGQGNTEQPFSELDRLCLTFPSIIRPFIERSLSEMPACSLWDEQLVEHGFDVLRWIDDPKACPSQEYLLSAPISMPLIALIQLCNYYLLARLAGTPLIELRASFAKVTGHSQGIVTAVVIGLSSDQDQLVHNTQQALKLLFCIGVYCTRTISIAPQFSPHRGNDGTGTVPPITATPMLSVSQLSPDRLLQVLDKVNALLPPTERICLALRNGPQASVCSGPPRSLHGLYATLDSMRARPEEDQSKVPFSQRRPSFTMRFLPIGCPFHSPHLQRAIPEILAAARQCGASLSITADNALSMIVDPTNGMYMGEVEAADPWA